MWQRLQDVTQQICQIKKNIHAQSENYVLLNPNKEHQMFVE